MTCVHQSPQAKFEFKDSSIEHKFSDMMPLTLNRPGFLQIGMAGGGEILLPSVISV